MADDVGTDVFISYKRRKRPEVEHIAAALRALKLTVWFDARLEPGVSFSDEIAAEVRRAKAVLVCWTNDCFPHGGDENGWVRAEASIARGRGVYVPCFLEPTDLDPPFNMDHSESLIGWATTDGLGPQDHEGWLDLLAAIGKKVGRPGLAAFSKAEARNDLEGLRRFAQEYPRDPLADAVWAQIAEADAAAARARIEAQRQAAVDAANRPAAPPPPPKPAFAQSPKHAEGNRRDQADRASPKKSPSRWLIGAGAAGALAVVLGLVITFGGGRNQPVPTQDTPVEQVDATTSAPAPSPSNAPPASAVRADEDAWLGMKQPARRADLEAFLQQYPDSQLATDARTALDKLAADELALARTASTPEALADWARRWPRHPEAAGVNRAAENLRGQEREAVAVAPALRGTQLGCPSAQANVYFEWDSSALTNYGIAVLQELLSKARACALRDVRIEGHTDSSKSTQYSSALSQRMASSVRSNLIREGVPPDVITTVGHGETRQAVVTGDGVREPLNRRAEVTFTFR